MRPSTEISRSRNAFAGEGVGARRCRRAPGGHRIAALPPFRRLPAAGRQAGWPCVNRFGVNPNQIARLTPPPASSEPRRSFIKNTLATSVSISFSGLIRAHGEEGGGTTLTTTYDPQQTATTGVQTTTYDPQQTAETTGVQTTTYDPQQTAETTGVQTTTYDPQQTGVTTAPPAWHVKGDAKEWKVTWDEDENEYQVVTYQPYAPGKKEQSSDTTTSFELSVQSEGGTSAP